LVALGVSRPTAAIEQAMTDFVTAFNELHAMLAGMTAPASAAGGESGALRGDLSIRELQRQLARLPSTILSNGGGPATLAEIGVGTNRDGTLSLNRSQLQEKLAADPDGVEALFNPAQRSSSPLLVIMSKMGKVKPGTYTLTDLVPAGGGADATGKVNGVSFISSGPHVIAPAGSPALGLVLDVKGAVASATVTVDAGLGGALQAIRDALSGRGGVFEAARERLNDEAASIADQRAALDLRSSAYYDRLVTQFTAMERQVSAFKATQSYLEQQIKIWSNSDD
jgi:flagellar hook-associated protein 2